MTSQAASDNHSALLGRLQKLESENRRMKQFGALVVTALAALILMGQASKNRSLEVDSLTIKGANGIPVIELGTTPKDHVPFLQMNDANGIQLVSLLTVDHSASFTMGGAPGGEIKLDSNSSGGTLSLSQNENQSVLGMTADSKGGDLTIFGKGGTAVTLGSNASDGDGPMLFLAQNKNGRTEVGVASIHVHDSDGFHAFLGKTGTENTKTGATTATSAASLTLFGKDGKVIWQAP